MIEHLPFLLRALVIVAWSFVILFYGIRAWIWSRRRPLDPDRRSTHIPRI
jgi:hypothetical protein